MAVSTSTSTSFFTSPNFTLNSTSSSRSISANLKYKRATVSAAYATTERTAAAPDTETIRSFRNACASSLYEVLGVRIGADTREVKAAYRKLARLLHPDVGSGESSADEFMKVHSAYNTLSDPEKRADYDRSLFQRRVGALPPVRSAGGFKSRRWETDQCW